MRKTLEWLGDVVGWFGGAFLVYVVVGTLLGRIIAVPFDGAQGCWPMAFHSAVTSHCDDPLAEAFWFGAVELPSDLITVPEVALLVLIARVDPPDLSSVDTYYVVNTWNVVAGTVVVVLLSLAGFVAWRARAPFVAWLLALGLVGQIAFNAIRAWSAW